VWNGFTEREPNKAGGAVFVRHFDALLDSMDRRRYRAGESPVRRTASGQLFDGAHRVAGSIVTGRKITVVDVDIEIANYDWTFFRQREDHVPQGLAEEYADAIALENIENANNEVLAAIVFPVVGDKHDDIVAALVDAGGVAYVKELSVAGLGRFSFIHQVYLGEPWNTLSRTIEIERKANGCFPSEADSRATLVILEPSGGRDGLTAIKDQIRENLGLGKHALHTTDTREETLRIAQMFCNANTARSFRALASWPPPPRFSELFSEYLEIPTRDTRCIDSSGVLGLYGLRDVNDLDYLHLGPSGVRDRSGRIEDHNRHAHWYERSIDEIVSDPRLHLYYCGQKFAAPHVVQEMKRRRGEAKDLADIELLEALKP